MSDSENWSSYETKSIPDNVKDTSKQDNFQWRQLKNRCMFGAIVGFTSGITFSVVDMFREKQGIRKMVQQDGMKRIAASSGLFTVYFCGFHTIKYGMEYGRKKDDVLNTIASAGLAGLPLIGNHLLRKNAPYLAMLVALDYFHDDLSPTRR